MDESLIYFSVTHDIAVDGNIFGGTNKLYFINPIPQQNTVRHTYTVIPDGSYKPEELGLTLPGCSSVTVGYCSLFDKWRTKWTLRGPKKYLLKTHDWAEKRILAHAHGTSICVRDGKYIFKDKDAPDEVIWHEYAHILADCDKHGHDDVWKDYARALGLSNPTPFTLYQYFGEPQVIWGRAS